MDDREDHASTPTVEELEAQLTDRQRAFVREYVVDYCGAQAAIRAGYPRPSATVAAARLKKHPIVSQLLTRVRRTREEQAQADHERLLEEQRRIAFSDFRELFGADGEMLAPHLVDHDIAQAVAEVTEETSTDREGVVTVKRRYKLHSKSAASAVVMKLHGFGVEKHEHTGPNGAPLTAVIVVPDNGRMNVGG